MNTTDMQGNPVNEVEEKFTKEDEETLTKLLEKKRRVELQQKQAIDVDVYRTASCGRGLIVDWITRNAEALEPLLTAYNKTNIQK